MIHVVAAIIGALVVVFGVIGFVRSLWRSPGRRGGGHNEAIAGTDMTVPGRHEGSHHGIDSGGHGGGGADGGHGGAS